MTPDEALEVFFVAVDEAFKPEAGPEQGRALFAAMDLVLSVAKGGSMMKMHTICGACGCKDKHPSRDAKRFKAPSTTHVRRRSCHSEATGLTTPKLPK